jgi:hypothetical protein
MPTPGHRLQIAELHMSGTPEALETPVATPQPAVPAEPQGDHPQPQL